MGFRFTINNANAIGHLVDGDIMTFLKITTSSEDNFHPTFDFIDSLMCNPKKDFYTTDNFWNLIAPELDELKNEWQSKKERYISTRESFLDLGWRHRIAGNYIPYKHVRILDFLQRLSNIFSRCKIKALLLPGYVKHQEYNWMNSPNLLRKLVSIHPGESALILQLKEPLYNKREALILNAFSKFTKAFINLDQWPGVLLWNDVDSLFLPVDNGDNLIDIFTVLKYEKDNFNFLRNSYAPYQNKSHFAYLFHLSDLHFGNKVSNKRKLRVLNILEKQLHELEDTSFVFPLITGDLMDTPSLSNKQCYLEFDQMLRDKGFEKPIYILGNHDIDTSGFIKLLTKQKSIITALSLNNKVELIDSIKLGIIKFDSNTGGEFAQGKIGEDQFIEIGNMLDSIPDRHKYTFIALLHHHPKEIENPTWYSPAWYETLLGKAGYEKTMTLVDSDLFLKWIEERKINYVLHGHKHIPNITTHGDVTIMGAGSSTGSVRHKEKWKTYLSYNLIKYDIRKKQPVSCSIIAEEIIGAGPINILVHRMKNIN